MKSLLPTTDIPTTAQSYGHVLRTQWLPIAEPQAAARYANLNENLLTDLFPNCVLYGPHFEEYLTFLRVFESLYIEQLAAGPDGKMTVFLADVEKTYGRFLNIYPRNGIFLHEAGDMLPVYIEAHHLILAFKIIYKFAPEFNYDPTKSGGGRGGEWLALVTQLILLQYLYLHSLQARGVRQRDDVYTGRNLVAVHNAFCLDWGLPTLHWVGEA